MRDYHLTIKAGQSAKVAGSESNFILCKAIVDPLATDLPSVRVTAMSSLHEGRVVLQSAFIASQYFKSPINELFTDVEITNESATDLSCTFAIGRGDLGDNYTSGLVQIDAISSDVVLKTLPQNLPEIQKVTVENLPADQMISGEVSVSNFPSIQNVKSVSAAAANAVTIQTINNGALQVKSTALEPVYVRNDAANPITLAPVVGGYLVKLNNGFYIPSNFGYSGVWVGSTVMPLTAPRAGSFKGDVTISVSGFAELAPMSGWLEVRLVGKWSGSTTHSILVRRVKADAVEGGNLFVSVTVPASFEINAAFGQFGSIELYGAGYHNNMRAAWYFAGETLA